MNQGDFGFEFELSRAGQQILHIQKSKEIYEQKVADSLEVLFRFLSEPYIINDSEINIKSGMLHKKIAENCIQLSESPTQNIIAGCQPPSTIQFQFPPSMVTCENILSDLPKEAIVISRIIQVVQTMYTIEFFEHSLPLPRDRELLKKEVAKALIFGFQKQISFIELLFSKLPTRELFQTMIDVSKTQIIKYQRY